MNEIERFKKGRMIPKGHNGLNTGTLNGRKVTYKGMGWVYDDTGERVAGRDFTSIHVTTKDDIRNNNMNQMGQVMQNAVSGSTPDYSWMTNRPARQRTPEEEARLKDPKIQAYLQRQQKEAEARAAAGKNAGSTKIGPRKAAKDWGKEFTNFMGGLSSEQQEWLRKNGLQDPKMLQEYLNNMKFDVGKFGADGKFGKDSRAAWDRFVASGIMGKNNDQEILKRQLEEQKKTEPVIDAPDPFGYKTTNTYEGDDFASKMKGMGIRSNADLINFMHNSGKAGWKGDAWQTQFRSDVDKALGGDYSDTNIRKVFGTQGRWGRGFMGRGDFGDFQSALQTNAGVWNGIYDRKQEEARMDAGRKQVASKMAQQYTVPQLTKSTVPVKDFSVGYKGANTLGEAGQGSMGGNDWMKFAAQYGYLPKQTTEETPQEDWMKFAAQTGYLPS